MRYDFLSTYTLFVFVALGSLVALSYAWLAAQEEPSSLWGGLRGRRGVLPVWLTSGCLAMLGVFAGLFFFVLYVSTSSSHKARQDLSQADADALDHHRTWFAAGLTLYLVASAAWAPLVYKARVGTPRYLVSLSTTLLAAVGTLAMVSEVVLLYKNTSIRAALGSAAMLFALVGLVIAAFHSTFLDFLVWSWYQRASAVARMKAETPPWQQGVLL